MVQASGFLGAPIWRFSINANCLERSHWAGEKDIWKILLSLDKFKIMDRRIFGTTVVASFFILKLPLDKK